MAENVMSLEEAKRARAKPQQTSSEGTHLQIAEAAIDKMSEEFGEPPVYALGRLWTFDFYSGLWTDRSIDSLAVSIGRDFPFHKSCRKASDYRAIAGLVLTLCERSDYFESAPPGIAAGGWFFKVTKAGEILREELTPEHRQRISVPMEPDFAAPAPLLDALLDNAFGSGDEGVDQKELLQMALGAALTRVLWRYRKVVMLYGASATGKSTVLDLLRKFFPEDAVGAVNPATWGNEYHAAALAGKALNLVGEIDGTTPIPGGVFKAFTGGDLVSGRHPTHKPINFRCMAAHLFNTNRLPPTRDKSPAFFGRWLILEFCRTIPVEKQIVGLADRIFDEEQPAVLAWMLFGAAKLLRHGSFIETRQHRRLIDYWRAGNNSALQFVMDSVFVELKEPPAPVTGMEAFQLYRQWAREVGVMPMGRNAFYEALNDGGARLGVAAEDDRMGVKVIRGIGLKKLIPG